MQFERLLGLLNKTLGTSYTDNVYFTKPIVNEDSKIERNTKIYVSIFTSSGYRNLELYYNRNSMRKAADGVTEPIRFLTTPDNTLLVNELNTEFNWEISSEDLVNAVMGYGPYALAVEDDNLGWIDQGVVTIADYGAALPEPGPGFWVRSKGKWVPGLSTADFDSLLDIRAYQLDDTLIESWVGSGFLRG